MAPNASNASGCQDHKNASVAQWKSAVLPWRRSRVRIPPDASRSLRSMLTGSVTPRDESPPCYSHEGRSHRGGTYGAACTKVASNAGSVAEMGSIPIGSTSSFFFAKGGRKPTEVLTHPGHIEAPNASEASVFKRIERRERSERLPG